MIILLWQSIREINKVKGIIENFVEERKFF